LARGEIVSRRVELRIRNHKVTETPTDPYKKHVGPDTKRTKHRPTKREPGRNSLQNREKKSGKPTTECPNFKPASIFCPVDEEPEVAERTNTKSGS